MVPETFVLKSIKNLITKPDAWRKSVITFTCGLRLIYWNILSLIHVNIFLWGARLYLHAVRPRNFLSSAEDANRVRGCYQVCFPSVGRLEIGYTWRRGWWQTRFFLVGIREIWRTVEQRWVWANHRWPRRAGYARVGRQYVTVATIVAIVGWLFRESASRMACTDRSLQWLLRSLLTSLSLRSGGPRWTLLSVGGVHFSGLIVGRVCVFGVWRLGECLLGP